MSDGLQDRVAEMFYAINWKGIYDTTSYGVCKVGEAAIAAAAIYGPEPISSAFSGFQFPPEFPFKHTIPFEDRKKLSAKLISENESRIPVIVEQARGSNLKKIRPKKMLVPFDLTLAMLIFNIRKCISIESGRAIFLISPDTGTLVGPPGIKIIDVYRQYKDPDGFLYLTFREENVFGSTNFR
jgi:hypothetical protein